MAETAPFRALAASLKDSGFAAHASRMEDILGGTWTTSSELIAELGHAVLDVRRQCRPLTSEQQRMVRDCLRQVRSVWPGFGRWRGISLPWGRW
jgi:hypothetical protein